MSCKEKTTSVKKNFIYNVAYQILVVIIPLITAPYTSRVLGANNVGVYSYTYSIANYFMLFAMLGIKNYGNRKIAQVRDDKDRMSVAFVNMYTLQLLMSMFMLVLYYIYVFNFEPENKAIAVIQSIYILCAATDITWFFFGIEEFKTTVIRNTVVKLISIVGIFAFVKSRSDLSTYALILAGSALTGYILLFPFLKKYITFVKPTWREIKSHIIPNLRLFIPVIAVSLFNVMDKIMLGSQSSMIQVGIYENTEKLLRIPLGVITALGTVMMPHMSHMISTGNIEKSKSVIEQSMIFIMCLACALAGGLAGIGRVFAPIFFGDEFYDCGILIAWMSPTILSLSWANVVRMQFLIPNKMDKEYTVSTFIGAAVNLTINYFLIPSLGALGAIIGTVCAETSLTIYQTYVVRKMLPIKRYFEETIGFACIGILMSLIVYLIGTVFDGGIVTLIFQIVIGVVIYIGLVVIYLSFSKNQAIRDFRKSAIETVFSKFKIKS